MAARAWTLARTRDGLVALFIVGAAACTAVRGGREAAVESGVAGEWTGKPMKQVVRELGKPTEVRPLIETGGRMLIYAAPDRPHYVIELGPDDRVAAFTEIR